MGLIWFSDRIILDGKVMKVDKRIIHDVSLQRKIELSKKETEFLEKAREKISTEQNYVKQLVENF